MSLQNDVTIKDQDKTNGFTIVANDIFKGLMTARAKGDISTFLHFQMIGRYTRASYILISLKVVERLIRLSKSWKD